jgi:hypothetical protein
MKFCSTKLSSLSDREQKTVGSKIHKGEEHPNFNFLDCDRKHLSASCTYFTYMKVCRERGSFRYSIKENVKFYLRNKIAAWKAPSGRCGPVHYTSRKKLMLGGGS